ncbi:murein biosynthesis integral membrane protein MurJ [Listeria sp. PSOL-1]|uniref:murein biosynthesis integral membrane protein MurJ n=1 Tax=Listeria sp. PSOL-1 TaxID=1844999 RepID=UPI0013D470DC|nr:lipid II flippase MurJ [Listeria sp. PSOL-1]
MLNKKITGVFSAVLIFTVLTQTMSILRTTLLAKYFGTSSMMDAFNLANLIMIAIVNIGGASIPVVIIPFLAKIKENRDEDKKEALNSYVITIMMVSLTVLLITYSLGFISMNYFHWKENHLFYYMTYLLTFIMGIGQIFRMYSWLQTSYLEFQGRFIWVKFAGLVAIVLNYLFILFRAPELTIYQVAISVSCSFLIESLLLVWGNRKWDYKFKFKFNFRSTEYRNLLKLTLPSIVGASIYQLTILVPSTLGSYFGVGYVSTMTYANQIMSIFQMLIITNLLSMIYPNLSRSFALSLQTGKEKFVQYIKLFNLIVIPVVVGLIVLGHEIIAILFERGSFGSESSARVFEFLFFLALALPFTVFKEMVFRIFYSIKDTVTPVKIGVISVVFQISFLFLGAFKLGVISLMVSPLITAMFSATLAAFSLYKKVSFRQELWQITKSQAKIIGNALIMGGVIYLFKTFFTLPLILDIITCTVLGMVSYAALIFLTDYRTIKQFLKKNHEEKGRLM